MRVAFKEDKSNALQWSLFEDWDEVEVLSHEKLESGRLFKMRSRVMILLGGVVVMDDFLGVCCERWEIIIR